jgi:3-hydroxyisobutyrate dehydrogenase
MRIGFIGLGNMGEVMAARLLNDDRLSLVVYDRNREAAKDLIRDGAVWAESLNQLANQCEIICSMLPGPTEMEEMTTGKDGLLKHLKSGTIYIDHTTNSPELIKNIGEKANDRGIHMLDAPVMGDRQSIVKGVLTMMVGGEVQPFEKARPIMQIMANEVIRVGPLGTGCVSKISLNAFSMSTDLLMAECMTLAVKAGVDLSILIDVMEKIASNSEGKFDEDARWPATLLQGKFLPSRFYLKLAYKDYRLFHELAVSNKVPARLVSLCEMETLEALNNGWENHERTITATLQEERSNVKLRYESSTG